MDHALWERIQAIFHDALERPDSERQAFVETACGDDRQMLVDVLAMLKADGRSGSLLDRGLPEVAYHMIGASLDSDSIREIGPYRLKSLLGEGGMGVVWLAERVDAGNLVAIKFLPHAGLSPARRERFAREIKTLAKLKHPYIARLYDAGALVDGTPWFVMEYVEGTPIGEYCRREQPPIQERLRLFRKVCEAVQYAHGQEIIHRDLKPSNILVEQSGTPRLLDFGIARELESSDEPSDRTQPGLRFLSPDYAAPEWIREGTVGLSTDVYSLGVILYELLAGRLPVKEADPLEPASAVVGRVAPIRKAEWSDLDVLCLKAMHRDPTARYQSAEALIRDIDHYLNQEPLEARPDTPRYRLGKFVARNRSSVAAASATVVLLVLLVAFFTLRLARERNTALAEAARTQRIQEFMLTLFGEQDKEAAPSNELRVATLLDRGAREAGVLNSDPETQAELYGTLGRMYEMLGSYQKADTLLTRSLEKIKAAVGADDPKTAEAMVQLGLLRGDEGRARDGEPLIRKGLDILNRHLAPDDAKVVNAQASLGRLLVQSGSYEKGIAVLEPIVRRPATSEEGSVNLLECLSALAVAELYTGHYQQSESLSRQAVALGRKLYGGSHPRAAADLANIATIFATQGRYAEAERLYREAAETVKAWYGPENPEVVQITGYVARMLLMQGKDSDAEVMLKQTLPLQEQTFGKTHPVVATTLDSLGKLAQKQGDLPTAEADFRRALAIQSAAFGPADVNAAVAAANLAGVLLDEGRDARAEELLRPAVKALTQQPHPGNLSVGVAQALLGRLLLKQHHYPDAEKQLTAAYAVLSKQPGNPPSKRLRDTREDLAAAYEALREPEKASRFRAELAAAPR